MRLNVTAATTAVAATETSISFSNCSSNNDSNIITTTDDIVAALAPTVTTSTVTTSNKIIENGTLIGIAHHQPSVTIQVNQNSQQQQQQQHHQNQQQCSNGVNQLNGVISINCYRAMPVHIVNNGSNLQNINNLNNNQNSSNTNECINSNINNNNNNSDDHISNQINVNANMSVKSEKCDIECINEDTNSMLNTSGIQSEFVNSSNLNISCNLSSSGSSSGCNNNNNNNNISSNSNNSSNDTNSTSHVQRTYISAETQTNVDVVKVVGRSNKNHQQQPNSLTDNALIDFSQSIPDTTVTVPPIATDSKPTSNAHGRRGGSSGNTDGQLSQREQRRRERRERRQARNARQQHVHLSNQSMELQSHHSNCEILPDILHSHVPPPYTTLPMPTHCQINTAASVLTQSPSTSVLVPGTPSALIPVGISDDGRYTFPLPIMRR